VIVDDETDEATNADDDCEARIGRLVLDEPL
jgi:hypothetical protein